MNYEEMSNYEINLAVAKILLRGQSIKYLPQGVVMNGVPEFGYINDVEIVTSSGMEQKLNFCSSPEKYTSLQQKEKIGVSWIGVNWVVSSVDSDINEYCDSAHKIGRAICIVFLKMMEAKYGK